MNGPEQEHCQGVTLCASTMNLAREWDCAGSNTMRTPSTESGDYMTTKGGTISPTAEMTFGKWH